MSVQGKLKKLSATNFEHVVYDLMIERGLVNATWRTPGADGGRDIQGEISRIDFTGQVVSEKWYVECKRYQAALDWPAVYQKVAYASNHQADVLFICTTGSLSPRCKDELELHNKRGAKPLIRFWDGADLEMILSGHKALLTKYGLSSDVTTLAKRARLLQIAAKVTFAAYGDVETVISPPPTVELSAALAELAIADEQAAGNKLPGKIDPIADLYIWSPCTARNPLPILNPSVLRASLCSIRVCAKCDEVIVSVASENLFQLTPKNVKNKDWQSSTAFSDLVIQIAIVGDVELSSRDGHVYLRPR